MTTKNYYDQVIPSVELAADDDAVAKAKREELRRKLLGGDTITLKDNGSATSTEGSDSTISIPKGKLADDANDKEKREELCQKLIDGEKIWLGDNGSAFVDRQYATICISSGKFADDAAAKAKREELRRKLLGGDTITLKDNGSATSNEGSDSTISIPKGKLAAQWYETNPQLLALERVAMNRAFPNFKMEKLDDGRLAWIGKLNIGAYESKFHQPMEYHVMALYMNNHPHAQMGSSVRVYPVLPDVQELINKCGFRPFHLLTDSNGDLYLCTNEADNQKTGNDITSAASVLGWACKWFLGYELVLTGDLDRDKFNQHGGI